MPRTRRPACAIDPALQVDALDSTEQVGSRGGAPALLRSGVAIDGVFAASDLIAIGATQCAGRSGLRVPEQVSVVGFDDMPMASYASIPLTTVQQDTKQAGEILVERLLQQIRGEPVESIMLPARVIVRRSCGARASP